MPVDFSIGVNSNHKLILSFYLSAYIAVTIANTYICEERYKKIYLSDESIYQINCWQSPIEKCYNYIILYVIIYMREIL